MSNIVNMIKVTAAAWEGKTFMQLHFLIDFSSNCLDKNHIDAFHRGWIIDPKKRQLFVYDHINGDFPVHYDLDQKVGVALYNGELVIDLKEIAELIQEWPE